MTQRHGVGRVFIDRKNNFHYYCTCGHDSPSIEAAREHTLAMFLEEILSGEHAEITLYDGRKMYRFSK